MFPESAQYKFSFILSISLHLLLMFFFLISFSFPTQPMQLPQDNTPIVHAVAINQAQVDQEIMKIKETQQAKDSEKQSQLANYQKTLQEIQQQKQLAKKQMADLQRQQKESKQQLEKLKAQQLQAKKSLKQIQDQAQTALKKQVQAKNTDTKKIKPVNSDQANATATADNASPSSPKNQTDQDANKLLQQQLTDEQQQLAQSRSQYVQSVLDRYKQLIISAIAQHWLVPSDVDKTLSCALLIELSQDGTVLNVQIAKSSGIPALDHSAILAVYKASPLPIPNNSELFSYFKTINLVVRPENVTSG